MFKRIIFLLVFIAGFIVGASGAYYFANSSLVLVSGQRAVFILTARQPGSSGITLSEELGDNVFVATVSFISRGRFYAVGHPVGGGPPTGYGYLTEARVIDDQTWETWEFSAHKADLLVDIKNNLGVSGTIRHKLSGFPAFIAEPEPGPATILLSNEIGGSPKFVRSYIQNVDGPLEILVDGKMGPGNSGSCVIQLQKDKCGFQHLCLVGIIFGGISDNQALAVPVSSFWGGNK